MVPRSGAAPLDLFNPPLSGVNLIEASAGTGKTYAIAAIYLHLVMGSAIPVDTILVVTFTVAATEELKGRIRAMLRGAHRAFTEGEVGKEDRDGALMRGLLERYRADRDNVLERLGGALRDFDRAAIFTIHGFCQRMLQDNAFESSALFETELLTDDAEILDEAAQDFWRARMYGAPEVIVRFAGAHGVTPGELVNLLKTRSLDPRVQIVPRPEAPSPSSIKEAFTEVSSLFREAGELWKTARDEVRGITLSALDEKRLNGSRIRRDYLDARISELDEFLAGNDPSGSYKHLDYFTASHYTGSACKGKEPPFHCFLDLWERFCEAHDMLESLVRDYFIALKTEFLGSAGRILARCRERRNARTFDDLLTGMHGALRGDANSRLAQVVRRKFRAALIDEFQDTDPLQYEIFSTIFGAGGSSFFMIGDPKQAIYRFRGADIFAYLRAAGSCDRRWSLAENYRSEPRLVGAVNTIFSRLDAGTGKPFVLDGIGFAPVKPAKKDGNSIAPLTIWFIDEKYSDTMSKSGPTGKINKSTAVELASRHTAGEIARLIAAGETAADIAVLVRKHSQAETVMKHLRGLGIPCVAYGTGSVFQTREAVELERVLAAISDPADTGLVNAALATEFWGKSGDEIARILTDDGEKYRASSIVAEYRGVWESGGFMPMFNTMLRDLDVRKRLISFEDGERRLTNVLHLGEVLHRAEQRECLGADGLLKWLRTREAEADQAEEAKIRLETDELAVRVITLHKSKGLEFPIVFCPCLFDQAEVRDGFSFHDPGDDNRPVLDLGTAGDEYTANAARALAEDLSENMRLMYVALTRAKRRCYIAWGHINDTDLSAPLYAFHHGRTADWDAYLAAAKETDKNKKIKISLTHAEKLADLKELESASNGSILVTGLPAEKAPRYRPGQAARPAACRAFEGTIERRWSLTSFSSLVFSAAESDVPDRDPSPGREPEETPPAGRTIHAFPRGTRAGTLIHSVFEKIDFADPSSPASRAVIAGCLRGHRFDAGWQEALETMAHNVLSAPLGGERPFRLSALAAPARLHELEFHFPAAGLVPAELARIILGGRAGLPGTADIIARLGLDAVNGFVRGFIDLVFRHDGRYYLLDWKSNHLGNTAEDYTDGCMSVAMAEHFYHLQYHIYAVALHRHLTRTLPGYRYREHFGGAYYLFVRGVDPGAPGRGVFFDRPSEELMTRLDAYIAGGEDVG